MPRVVKWGDSKFWRMVNRVGPVHPICGQCWVWIGRLTKNGYGRHGRGGKRYLAHRYSWILHCGAIRGGLFVLHQCDNPACVNPAHLFLGIQQDNLSDMRSKGRQVRGEEQGAAKLTKEQVLEIRQRYRRYSHEHGSGALAREFNVSPVEVWRIATGCRWEHL